MRCVDSSFVIDLLRGLPAAVARAAELDAEGQVVALPAPCVPEVVRGGHLAGPREVRRTEQLLAQFEILPLDLAAAHTAGRIAVECDARGTRVPMLDCLIAGIVREHHAPLISRDSDFARIPGLLVETY